MRLHCQILTSAFSTLSPNRAGKGSFGEIFLASDDCTRPVHADTAPYVVKIEPHSNGPLFVEIHCLMNAGKSPATSNDTANGDAAPPPPPLLPPGMPDYIASGSHRFGAGDPATAPRYRFLILRRYTCDLSALVEQRQLNDTALLCVAVQIVDVLEHLHGRGYAHSDIKAENLMLGSCTYERRRGAGTGVDVARVKRVDKELRACLARSEKAAAATAAAAAAAAASGKRPTGRAVKREVEDVEEEEVDADEVDDGEGDAEHDHSDDDDDGDVAVVKAEPQKSERWKKKKATTTQKKTKNGTKRRGRQQPVSSDEDEEEDDDDGDDDSSRGYRPPNGGGGGGSSTAAGTSNGSAAVMYSGSNPVRSCRGRVTGTSSTYQDMLSSHYLRPIRKIDYGLSDDSDGDATVAAGLQDDKDFECPKFLRTPKRGQQPHSIRKRKVSAAAAAAAAAAAPANDAAPATEWITEDRIHLIDFGLAIKFVDSAGQHRPFCMDARRAHDGTLEFTSRDAHMGAHSRRSDLECFGYNLLYWTQGWLPWKEDARCMQQPEQVHRMKEYFMTDVAVMFQHVYGRPVPHWIGQFMRYVGSLAYHDRPDYALCRNMFYAELMRLGVDVRDPDRLRLCAAELQARPAMKALQQPQLASAPAQQRLLGENGAGLAALPEGMVTPQAAVRNRNGTENVTPVGRADVNRSMMKLGLLLVPALPFREVTGAGANRISPKNLRSASEKLPKEQSRKQKQCFSWTEILSTDPDQIARKRAEKEFDRDPTDTPLYQRYKGKPTYAILEVIYFVYLYSLSLESYGRCAHQHSIVFTASKAA